LESNPYTPPQAELGESIESESAFYVVAIPKFTILFFATLGMYGFYWFYANWQAYRNHTGEKIWPVPRALFSIFFAHSLFTKIQARLEQRKLTYEWAPRSVATWYVIVSIMSNILDRMSMREVWSPNSDILSVLILPAIYYTLLIPQRVINLAEGDSAVASNRTLTPVNYLWILLGAALWLLAILGLLAVTGYISFEE